jgi:hypothetical protein
MPILDLFSFILDLINRIVVPLIFAAAFLVFVFGVAQAFIFNGGDPNKIKDGRKFALYGIIGFFLMLSVWGLVNILVGTFGFRGQNRPDLPSFGGDGYGSSRSGGTGLFGGSSSGGNGNRAGQLGDSCKPSEPPCDYGIACRTSDYVCVRPEDI